MNNSDAFVIKDGVLEEYKGETSHIRLVIPEDVVEINAFVFENMKIEYLSLPKNLRLIGEDAFAGCNLLFDVVIPEGVEMLGDECFCECVNLRYIIIPSTCRTIGERAFSYTRLKEVIIPEGVNRIGEAAFGACINLRIITLPSSLTEMGEDIFCEGSENVTICAPKDSFAIEYAKQFGLNYLMV